MCAGATGVTHVTGSLTKAGMVLANGPAATAPCLAVLGYVIGAALAGAMHGAGINMRYLGLVAERATLPHVHDLLVVEMLCRQVSSTTDTFES